MNIKILLSSLLLLAQTSLAEIPFERDFSTKFPHKSNGYRVGYITKGGGLVDSSFMSFWGISPFNTCEVEMNVGSLTGAIYGKLEQEKNPRNKEAITFYNMMKQASASELEKIDNDETDTGDLIRISPWYFNVNDKNKCNEFKKLEGMPVVIHYRQPYRNLGVQDPTTSTTYRFINAFPVRNKPFRPSFVEDTEGYIQFRETKAAGQSCGITVNDCSERIGQIIKVSRKGKVVNSWEMQIAVGKDGTGGVYLMSITSPKIARWAVLAMASGLPVRVHYSQIALKSLNVDSWFKDTNILARAMELMPLQGQKFPDSDFKMVPDEVLTNREINLDNYMWDSFIDTKEGVQSYREMEQKK